MKILIAGSTGYLGSHMIKELLAQNRDFKALARNTGKLKELGLHDAQIIRAEVTQKNTLMGVCKDIDIVISSVGITRQKDGMSYMDVDYQANKNLLDEALKQGVKKFIYISVLHGDKFRNTGICQAKERFVDELKVSGLEYCIIRPSGFFSDLSEFYEMAKKGRIYLFGKGEYKLNPIDGRDLALFCIEAMASKEQELEVGGPTIYQQKDIAELAFASLYQKPSITYIPDIMRRWALKLASWFMPKAAFGPLEFFLHVIARDMIAAPYGMYSLEDFYQELAQKENHTEKTS